MFGVCPDYNATTDAECSHRWTVYPITQSQGGTETTVQSQQECLERCVASSSCVAAHWIRRIRSDRCNLHYGPLRRRRLCGNAIFELNRQCNGTAGSMIVAVFISVA